MQEIEAEVAAGRLRDWWQYPELLEDYDEHEPLCEGWDGAKTQVLGSEEELARADDTAEAGGGDIDDLSSAEADDAASPATVAAPLAEADGSFPARAGLSVDADQCIVAKAASSAISEDLERRARAELESQVDLRKTLALFEAIALLPGTTAPRHTRDPNWMPP